jgi:hypothetical protein
VASIMAIYLGIAGLISPEIYKPDTPQNIIIFFSIVSIIASYSLFWIGVVIIRGKDE